METYTFYLTDNLEKVFLDQRPTEREALRLFILKGEVPSLQLVYHKENHVRGAEQKKFRISVSGFPAKARFRSVEPIPSAFPCYEEADENYLRTQPGLYPDLLKPMAEAVIRPVSNQYHAVWIDFPETEALADGTYSAEVRVQEVRSEQDVYHAADLHGEDDACSQVLRFTIQVCNAAFPEQTLIHTEWFHADCIADYYGVPVFGERHWELLAEQLLMAGREHGVNMILTPVFTPPLDTAVGGERTTVQLVDISMGTNGQEQSDAEAEQALNGKGYRFDFSKLERWCALCRQSGIRYIEVPHLFTQWGAKAAPKIMMSVDGKEEKRFGWHTPADSVAYRTFLAAFLPALQDALGRFGYDRAHVFFHISDEPSGEQLDSYLRAKEQVADLLAGWQVIDALSDYAFYEQGVVERPIPANNHVQTFIAHKVPRLWTYYCCSQCVEVPNRFFAMPSARNRIMGVLMYLYQMEGFLHWGYNFYNTQHSKERLDPFCNTHAGYAFPSGDAFLVYPGRDGKPWSSIRAEVQRAALDDLRVLQAVEVRIGRARTEALIYEGEQHPFTFKDYPRDAGYFERLRERVAQVLETVV